ncbi:MAG: aldo/keto reductase [Anaerofustis stercorihominis]|nr:aldo/keto reductase [Anaerofustis stercorihominis]
MNYTYLKGTGLKVSKCCLGTMTFGGQANEEDSIRIIDYAIDHGVNFIDTANIYTGGQSETIVGKALKGKRDDIVLATKVCGGMSRKANDSGLGRKHIMKSVDESLKRLDTDYIDLYYMHFPDENTPMEEAIETMTNLVRSGKIRYYGVSNFSAWQFCSLIHKAKEMNAVAPVVTQSVYNAVTRGLDDEMVPFLKEYNRGLAVFNPLAGGLLTGKHTKAGAAEGSRLSGDGGYAKRYWKDGNLDAMETLRTIAEENNMSMSTLCLKWLQTKDFIDSVICGVSKFNHAEENIAAFDGDMLAPEVVAKIDSLWDGLKGDYFNYHR